MTKRLLLQLCVALWALGVLATPPAHAQGAAVAVGQVVGPVAGIVGGNAGQINSPYDLAPYQFTLTDLTDIQHTFRDVRTYYLYGMKHFITLDPNGNTNTDAYSMNVELRSKVRNPSNMGRLTGLDAGAYHLGTGTLSVLNGITGQANLGHSIGDGFGGNVTSAQGVRGKVTNNSTATITRADPIQALGANTGAGTVDTFYTVSSLTSNEGPGLISYAYGNWTQISNTSTGQITNGYGNYLRFPNNSGGGTFTNYYGWYIEDQTLAGSTINYTLYSPGTLKSYFGGPVGTLQVYGTGSAPAVSNTTANSCGTTAAAIGANSTNTAGFFTVGATSGTSCTLTFTVAAPNGWACAPSDETTGNLMRWVRLSTTTGKILGTMVAGDVIVYYCGAY